LNIDAPIALAIAITFSRSLYEIFYAGGNGYFDSMSGIVFLMLLGRMVQQRTYRSISFDRDFTSFFPVAINVKRNDVFVPVPVSEIKKMIPFRYMIMKSFLPMPFFQKAKQQLITAL